MSTSVITGSGRAVLIGAFALLVLAAGRVEAQRALTVVSWGGAYTKSQMLAFVRPFERQTGVGVDMLDYSGGLERIRAQVRSLNVKWDVVDVELTDAIRGCDEGLFEPMDPQQLAPAPDGTPASQDFIGGTLTRCAAGTVMWSTVIAYDPSAFPGRAPQRLEDFFDPERFPGPRALRRTPKANLEWALLADGVPPERLYLVLETEAGLERALAILERIKPQLRWWEAGAEAVRLLETDRVVMSSAYSGRVHDAVATRNADIAVLWDRHIWNVDLLAIPKGTPQREQAMEFIRFATSTESLARQARHIPYGPVRRSSLRRLEPEVLAYLPTAPQHLSRGLQIDARWWAQHYERINRRFEEWLERPVGVPRALPR